MDKKAALQNALDMIEKQYGAGSIMKLGDEDRAKKVATSSSGSLSLDLALGGWYAKGRIVEIYGPESSGKTTLTLHAIAEVQKAGGTAAFIDAEHALDPSYAEKIWVNTSELIISQPDYGEQALEIADNLIRSGAIDIVVVDSVAALTPKSEIEGEVTILKTKMESPIDRPEIPEKTKFEVPVDLIPEWVLAPWRKEFKNELNN